MARRHFTADEIVELVCLPDGANSDDGEVTDDEHDDETYVPNDEEEPFDSDDAMPLPQLPPG